MKTILFSWLLMLTTVGPLLAGENHSDAPACCRKSLSASAPLNDTSLYQIDSHWTNDVGKPVQLAALRGKPQVITMFYASCQFTCPLLVHDMQRIESALPENIRGKVGFTLVSFDPERDTPTALSAYRQRLQLDQARWTLLQGKDDDVLELAALLGMKFKKDAQGQFVHSNLITLLDSEGNIVRQENGFGQSIDGVTKAIEKLFATTAAQPTLSDKSLKP